MASIITQMNTAIAAGPTAATSTKTLQAAGPIGDYPGNCKLVLLKLQEAKVLLTTVIAQTDAADPSLTNLNTVLTDLA